jgi:pimeloyl-ACP methyl ester carboxylesterase
MKNESLSFKSVEGEKEFLDAYNKTLSLWDIAYDSIYIETTYGKTHIITAGAKDGKPILLIHGFGFGAPMWYPNVANLSKDYKIYAIDVIGEFNKSVIMKSFNEKKDYAEWLSEILDYLKIEKATFIGHSNGGWHAINFAIHCPDRTEQLILLAPAASFIRFSIQFPIRLVMVNIIKTRSIIVNFFGKWFVAKGNSIHDSMFEQFYHGIIHFKWKYKILIPSVFPKEELEKINVPILLLVGDKEVIYNYKKLLKRATEIFPHIKTSIIPNAGHVLSIEKADIVNSKILEFLS